MTSKIDYMKPWRPTLIGVGVTLTFVATIVLVLRIYTYYFILNRKGGEALLWGITAWIFGLISMALYNEFDSLSQKMTQWLLRYIVFAPKQLSITFTKLGMVSYILQIQGQLNRFGKWLLLATIALLFVCIIVTCPIFYIGGIYSKSHALPKRPHRPPKGDPLDQWFYWTGILYAFTDLLLAVYPVYMTWNLRIATRAKVIICLLMSLGAIGTAVNVANILVSVLITDFERYYGLPFLLDISEIWLVFIAASVAPLWPLLTLSREEWLAKFRASLAWVKLRGGKKSADSQSDSSGR